MNNAIYHVTLRGNHREPLFEWPQDREALNDIVRKVVAATGAKVHGFCWMTNHLHALIQVGTRPLGQIMQPIAMRYSRYRHQLLRVTGHHFDRRHGAKLVDTDDYFLTALRYIHLNPVSAGLTPGPAEYPWSSHRVYLSTEHIPWVTTDYTLSLLSPDREVAREIYRRMMSAGHGEGVSPPRSLDDLGARISAEHGITPELLRSASRERSLCTARTALATRALEHRFATIAEIAQYLGRTPQAVALMVR